jgi:hypothetical protein
MSSETFILLMSKSVTIFQASAPGSEKFISGEPFGTRTDMHVFINSSYRVGGPQLVSYSSVNRRYWAASIELFRKVQPQSRAEPYAASGWILLHVGVAGAHGFVELRLGEVERRIAHGFVFGGVSHQGRSG